MDLFNFSFDYNFYGDDPNFKTIRAPATDKPLEVWADALYVGGRDTVDKARNVMSIFRNIFGSKMGQ